MMKPNAVDLPTAFHPASSPDYVPREHLRRLQSERLRSVVGRAFDHVTLYRQRMHKCGVTPSDVRGVEDLAKLPFTAGGDLEDAYPTGMFAVPLQQIARLTPPASPLGKPVVSAHTAGDLSAWTDVAVRALACAGFHQGDVVQNACGHDLPADALGLRHAAETLGATVISGAGGDMARAIAIMRDFSVSAVCSTPSFFLYLIERAEQLGVNLRELPLRVGAFVGEPWSEAMRERIEQSTGINAFDLYGLAELAGPGIAAECIHQDGLHIFEDHFYPEIIDPDSGEPLSDGEEGELVLTTLTREAMPLIRYRTHDLTAIVSEPCACGRTLRRIRRIGGRSDDVFAIQGTSILPSQIEAAILAVEGTLPHYQIVLTEDDGLDQATVEIEVTPQILSDRVSAMENLQDKLAEQIERSLGVSLAVRLVEPNTIERSEGKARRVIDNRAKS